VATETSIPTPTPPPEPEAPARRLGSPLSLLGAVISVVALAGVVWWALQQDPPRLPHTGAQIAAMFGAIGCYALATLVRGERWWRLLREQGGRPSRVDTQALNVIGYMGNNVLPARAGDAIRVVLMAPLAAVSKRTVVGTLLAERLLDIAVITVLFVVVGYGLLGEVGGGSVELIALVTAAGVAVAVLGWRLVRRNERLHAMLAPMASATLALRGRYGLVLLAMTVAVWAMEVACWQLVGASVGLNMNPIEAAYIVALASVFALIPSGPGYAGTQDAAVAIGVKALGGTGATAVSYVVMLRFVIVVPITALGFALLAARYGGLGRLRGARLEARAQG